MIVIHPLSARLTLIMLTISLVTCVDKPIKTSASYRIDFSPIAGWQQYAFAKKTVYSLQKNTQGDIIKAFSDDSASMLYKKVNINLNHTPYINWRWKISNTLGSLNEKMRLGDDYPARIYIAVTSQELSLQPQALNYVWSSNSKKLSHWNNAFNSNSIVIALESGNKRVGQWLMEKRNLKKDLASYLGHEIDTIKGIAIMTDTDNSNTQVTAYYADIFFSTQ